MKKKEAEAKGPETVKSVEEMILDYPVGKYSAIPLAAFWAKELRRREEHRHLTSNEILDLSLRDVLSGEVDWKDLKKATAASAAALNGEAEANGGKKK
jgi:hypothetical protein